MKPNCQAIVTARKRRGWTQADLAEKAGIALRVVQDTENHKVVNRGRRFHPESMKAVAGALAVSLETIVENDLLKPEAVVAEWLRRALDRGRDQCEQANQPYTTTHLLRTLLRIPQGAAQHCFGQIGSTESITEALEADLAEWFPPSDEQRFYDFDWPDLADFNRALKIASAVRRATDKHLLYAVLTGQSETVKKLRARLGEMTINKLLEAVEEYPDEKPPGWSNRWTPRFSPDDDTASTHPLT